MHCDSLTSLVGTGSPGRGVGGGVLGPGGGGGAGGL